MKRCSKKYATNLYENTNTEVWFQWTCQTALLKSHFSMGLALQHGCYIFVVYFVEHLWRTAFVFFTVKISYGLFSISSHQKNPYYLNFLEVLSSESAESISPSLSSFTRISAVSSPIFPYYLFFYWNLRLYTYCFYFSTWKTDWKIYLHTIYFTCLLFEVNDKKK